MIDYIKAKLEPEKEDNVEFMEDFESHLSTGQANYHFNFGHEQNPPNIDERTLENSDAIVLEESFHRYEELELEDLENTKHHQKIIDDNIEGPNLPIYLADMPEENKDNFETNILKNIATGYGLPIAAGLSGALAGHPESALLASPALDFAAERPELRNGDSKIYRETLAASQMPRIHSVFGMRSAIVASKMENPIADDIDEENPNISINYGQGHHDMINFLRFPRVRESLVNLYSWRDFKEKDEDYEDRICVFRPPDTSYSTLSDYKKEIIDF